MLQGDIAIVVIVSNIINYIQINIKNLGALKAVGYTSGQLVLSFLFFFILRAESQTESATVPPNIISEIITGNGKATVMTLLHSRGIFRKEFVPLL